MRRSQPRLLIGLIVLVLFSGVFYGCAAKFVGKQPGGQIAINKIEPREVDGKTEITIEGAEPILQYTSFQLSEPLRLVVDISGADLGKLQNRMEINQGAVLDIVPTQMDSVARLEIGLKQSVDAKLYQVDGKLVVELAGLVEPVAEPAAPVAAPETADVPVPEVPSYEQKGTASVVKAVKAVAGKDGVKLVISADGTMVPNTFMIEGKKLVIDIPGTLSNVKPRVIPVRKGGVDKVRIGQHIKPEKKVRIVLDLTRPMSYTAAPEGNQVLIAMVPVAADKAENSENQQERAAAFQQDEKPTASETEIAAGETPGPAAVDQSHAEPSTVARVEPATRVEESAGIRMHDMLTSPTLIGNGKYSGRKISLDLQDADLINVLRLFADVANLNIILAPDVKGKVTVRMVDIPWDQAMDIILKMNGLGYALEDNILRIASVSTLTKEAEEESRAKEAKKKAEDLITRVVSINYAKAGEIEPTLKKSLSSRGETVVDTRTNTIIIKDIPKNIEEVLTLIKLLDKAIPQVMIEARIVEATTSFTRDIGVQWGGNAAADASHGNAPGFTFPSSIGVTGGSTMGSTASGNGNYFVNMPAGVGQGSGGSIGFSFGSLSKALNLDLVLSAMESTGEGKVISTPRVSALDNKEAKIQQGQSIPYTSTSSSGTQVQFIEANLALTVTPHVTPDNKIFMKISASKNAPDTSLLGAGGQPSIRKNEATTEILLADGETAVIGGILIIDRGETIQKVPFFGDLPLVGWMFRQKTVRDDKRELLIFITPRVVKLDVV